ncbi:SpoIIE family protein phosphatase [Streptomyces sp. WMMB303]|uniref:SpoIIE family protein phosphatase n=1 Tax=Streptomyces sp. WMMB303 TaxID=3034154 RepID=UPI0023EB4881|nr:SpoIIE family protein phosphatase [Streptomyces sp. WMMB303]MDF4251937.1 SpoIIE family protein phosphatase [Streptomyces sp. WMMB303]
MASERDLPTEPLRPREVADPAMAVIDTHGTVTGWTPAAEALLGRPAADVVGRSAAALLTSSEDVSRAAEAAGHSRARGSWTGLTTLLHRSGRPVEVGLRVCPLSGPDGRKSWLAAVVDLGRAPSWVLGGPVLEAFLTRSPLSMAVLSPDLRYVWINDELERLGGVPRVERLGRRLADTLPGLDTRALEAQMRRVLATGAPVIDYEYRGWTPADPHREHAYSTSFFRLDDADGDAIGLCYMVMDVTERWRARERLTLINEAGTRIGSTLDVEHTAQELADFAVPRFADFVTVDLVESVLRGEEPTPDPRESLPAFRRAGLRSVTAGTPESVVGRGARTTVDPASPFARAFRSGEALIDRDLDDNGGGWLNRDPERVEKIRQYGMHSLIAVPVRARGTIMGVASFVRSRYPVPFEEDDLLLAEDLVSRAALCVDNARRYTREHTAALTLQRSLLPHALRGGTAVEVAWRYLPSGAHDGVGGDWFDVIPLSGARVALIVGDVVGHGINAAATMGRLRTAVHTLADMELPPDELLARLDDLVMRLTEEEARSEPSAITVLGATCLYAVYDPVTRRCTMARAGHPPPAVVRPDGTVAFADLPAGPPLGLGGLPFESAELELPAGSLVALYTDGLVGECGPDIDAGLSRLEEVLAHPEQPLESLSSVVIDSLLPVPPSDDAALLLARTHALTADHVVSWELPAEPAVVARARSLVADRLRDWGLEGLILTTELMASELVTNAIRHGAGPIRLRLIRHTVLVCEVTDSSSTSPRLRHPRTTDEGGRGLFLVAQLSRRWGTRYTEAGKLIWAEQDIPAAPEASPDLPAPPREGLPEAPADLPPAAPRG